MEALGKKPAVEHVRNKLVKFIPGFPKNHGSHFLSLLSLGIQSTPENGFMEPKYLAEEVIVHPNHHLTR